MENLKGRLFWGQVMPAQDTQGNAPKLISNVLTGAGPGYAQAQKIVRTLAGRAATHS